MPKRTPWPNANARRAGSIRGGSALQRRNQQIKQRDHHTCQLCDGTRCNNQRLEVDHIDGDCTNEAWDNLRTVGANPCHMEQTQRQAAAGRAKRTTRRTPEPHPGITAT